MVSFNDSPLVRLLVAVSEKPITRPCRRLIAVSKLRRVRVEGSKKSVAQTIPFKKSRSGLALNLAALLSMRKISSLL